MLSRILFTEEISRHQRSWQVQCRSGRNSQAVVEIHFQHIFCVDVWYGMFDNYLIDPFIFENRLIVEFYLISL